VDADLRDDDLAVSPARVLADLVMVTLATIAFVAAIVVGGSLMLRATAGATNEILQTDERKDLSRCPVIDDTTVRILLGGWGESDRCIYRDLGGVRVDVTDAGPMRE